MGANVGATRANDFPRQADECGQAAGDHARWRTDPDDAERDTGNYGSDAPDTNDSRRPDTMIRNMYGMVLAMSDGDD